MLHVQPPNILSGDDMVIQPNGDWIHVGDFQRPITRFSPVPPHMGTPSALNIQDIFADVGLPYVFGSRATVCDSTGDLYISYSGAPGGSAIFRVDAALTTATPILMIPEDEGLQDLTLGPATLGPGFSVYFTVHNFVNATEEVWEVTVPECVPICEPDPLTQGYWHRQCLGIPAAEGGIDPGRNGRGPQSPIEPEFQKDLMPVVSAMLEQTVFETGGACAGGMSADPPSDKCEKAIKQYTALLFNIASDRLQPGCGIDLSMEGCFSTTIGDLVDELAGIINTQDQNACNIAAACAAAINEGFGSVETLDMAVETQATLVTGGGAPAPASPAVGSYTSEPAALERVDPALALLAVGSLPASTVKPSTPVEESTPTDRVDELLTGLSGGYEPEVRLEMVKELLGQVDVALQSLLVAHLEDIRIEALDLGKEDLAQAARKLMERFERSGE